MAERAPSVRQKDIERAFRAAIKAGVKGAIRVEVDRDGKMIIIASQEPATADEREGNPWDRVLG